MTVPIQWTAQMDKRLRTMFKNDVPIPAIAKSFGLSCTAVYSRRDQLGLKRKPLRSGGETPWAHNDTKFAIKLYNKGVSCETIGRKIGKTRNAVAAKMDRLRNNGDKRITRSLDTSMVRNVGGEYQPAGAFSDEQTQEIFDRYENRYQSYARIAREMRLPYVQVERQCRAVIRDLQQSEGA